MENSQIKPGDIVRLLQPFKAERYSLREYAFGIVAGVVPNDSTRSKISQPHAVKELGKNNLNVFLKKGLGSKHGIGQA